MQYIVPHISHYDMILGFPLHLNPNGEQGPQLDFENGVIMRCGLSWPDVWKQRKDKRDSSVQIFAGSLKDIENALKTKIYSDSKTSSIS
jgi:hypothetical protein